MNSLRCKPGDLAFLTQGPHLGLLVTVLFADSRPVYYSDMASAKYSGTHHWICDTARPVRTRQMLTSAGYMMPCQPIMVSRFTIPDALLRPVRDGDGTDETLTWLATPTTDQVPA